MMELMKVPKDNVTLSNATLGLPWACCRGESTTRSAPTFGRLVSLLMSALRARSISALAPRGVVGREGTVRELGQAQRIALGRGAILRVGQAERKRGTQLGPGALNVGALVVGRGEVEEEKLGGQGEIRAGRGRDQEGKLVAFGVRIEQEREALGLVQGEAESEVVGEVQVQFPAGRDLQAEAAELRVERDRVGIGPGDLEIRVDLVAVRREVDLRIARRARLRVLDEDAAQTLTR